MTATLTTERLKARLGDAISGQDDGLRAVALRLAGQTVILLLVMLIALEIVVYIITQQTLTSSLTTILRDRAGAPDPTLYRDFHFPASRDARPGFPPGGGQQTGPPGGSGPRGAGPRIPNLNPSEASAAYVNTGLFIVHADGALGNVLIGKQDARRAIVTKQSQCCSKQKFKGQDYLVYTDPLQVNGKIVGAVQTSISLHEYEQAMSGLLRALLVVAILGLLISGGISALLVGRALAPIRAAVARQRDFVADAAHELRTPLAIQRTVGEVGMSALSTDDLQGTVAQMLGENQHLTRLVEDLSLLARTDANVVGIDRQLVDLSSLVTETAQEIGFLAEAQDISLILEIQPAVRVTGDILRLRQLLLILLDNALKHTAAGGSMAVRVSRQGERAVLQVVDSGPGIDPADLPRIFDRFYRSDRARTGEGSGLGLAIGRWIAEAHGGHIHADNAREGGAVFTVTLPAVRTEPRS